MKPTSPLRLRSIVTLLALAACNSDPTSSDSTLSPLVSAAINADVASVATDVTSQKIEVMRGPSGLWGFGLRAD
ncbi:MAG: hypothetical protein ABIT38_05770, partial [Gemmatimonadaceae bacterium]